MAHSWANTLYDLLPYSAQNLVVSLVGSYKKRSRLNSEFRDHLARLEQTQWMSDEETNLFWRTALLDLVKPATRDAPAYRGITFDEGGSWEQILASFPVTNKSNVRAEPRKYRSVRYRRSDIVCQHTSGTTGSPLEVWLTPSAHRMEYAFIWQYRSWFGIKPGDRIATVAGHKVVPIRHKHPPFSRLNRAENQLFLSSYHMSRENLASYIRDLARFNPVMIHGYPSSIYLLAARLADGGVPPVRPKVILTSSETLLGFQQELIEKQFQCSVRGWYGNAERSANIAQCPEGSYHLRPEYGIVEFIGDDGEAAPTGSPGRLVTTGLFNPAMPFIRYDTGDLAVPEAGRCRCGRAGRLASRIDGRIEDYVVTTDGRLIGRLDHVFKGLEGVREARLVQEKIGAIRAEIVPSEQFTVAVEAKIVNAIHSYLGDESSISVARVDCMPRGPEGKFRFVISEPGSTLLSRWTTQGQPS